MVYLLGVFNVLCSRTSINNMRNVNTRNSIYFKIASDHTAATNAKLLSTRPFTLGSTGYPKLVVTRGFLHANANAARLSWEYAMSGIIWCALPCITGLVFKFIEYTIWKIGFAISKHSHCVYLDMKGVDMCRFLILRVDGVINDFWIHL